MALSDFISHSASVMQLQFLYQVALANRVKDKVIVDIGSRLGAVLYSGYLFTRASKLIGVELNEWFCKLQQEMVNKYKMGDRVEVSYQDGYIDRYPLTHPRYRLFAKISSRCLNFSISKLISLL